MALVPPLPPHTFVIMENLSMFPPIRQPASTSGVPKRPSLPYAGNSIALPPPCLMLPGDVIMLMCCDASSLCIQEIRSTQPKT